MSQELDARRCLYTAFVGERLRSNAPKVRQQPPRIEVGIRNTWVRFRPVDMHKNRAIAIQINLGVAYCGSQWERIVKEYESFSEGAEWKKQQAAALHLADPHVECC